MCWGEPIRNLQDKKIARQITPSMLHAATLKIIAAIVAKSRTQFCFVQRLIQVVPKKFRTLQSMLHGTMNHATCLAMALQDKLHEKLHRVTGPLGIKNNTTKNETARIGEYMLYFIIFLCNSLETKYAII